MARALASSLDLMKRIVATLVALLVFGSSQAATPVLSAASYGQVVFGDRLEDVEKRINEKAPPITDSDENACRQIEFKTYPGVYFMIEEGRITRAESSNPIPSSIGYTVGASMAEIKKKIPSAVIEPHHYTEGHYITVKSKDGKAAILMEEAEGKVTDIRGGLLPSVQYVEGCL